MSKVLRCVIAVVVSGLVTISGITCTDSKQENSPLLGTSLSEHNDKISVLSDYPFTIEDSNGEMVTISQPPVRIIAIDSSVVEFLFLMGEGHRIVGVHNLVSYPPEVEDINSLGDAFSLDLEKITELDPDLVTIFFDTPVKGIKNLGVPTLFLKSPSGLQGVSDRMRLWGRIIGNPAVGEQIASQFEQSIVDIQNKVSVVRDGPRIYHDASPGLWTSGSGSLSSEVYKLLHANNIFSDISGFKQVSSEEIVSRDPEVIISVYPEGNKLIESDPAFKNISAVKSNQLFVIESDLLGIAGPRLIKGIEQIAKFIYPDLFP